MKKKYLPCLIKDLKSNLSSKENIENSVYKCYVYRWDNSHHSEFIKEDTEFNSIGLYNNPKKKSS